MRGSPNVGVHDFRGSRHWRCATCSARESAAAGDTSRVPSIQAARCVTGAPTLDRRMGPMSSAPPRDHVRSCELEFDCA